MYVYSVPESSLKKFTLPLFFFLQNTLLFLRSECRTEEWFN